MNRERKKKWVLVDCGSLQLPRHLQHRELEKKICIAFILLSSCLPSPTSSQILQAAMELEFDEDDVLNGIRTIEGRFFVITQLFGHFQPPRGLPAHLWVRSGVWR